MTSSIATRSIVLPPLAASLLAASMLAASMLASCSRAEPGQEIVPVGEAAPARPPSAEQPDGEPGAQPSAAVRWAVARAPGDRSLLDAPAEAVAAAGSHANVAPPFAARVVAIHVAPGDRVRAGDPLIEASMPAVLDAAAIWMSGGRRLSVREKRRAQLQALRDEGLVESGRVFEQEADLSDVRGDRTRALAVLRAAGVEPSHAAAILARGTIAIDAPIDGVVATLDVALGEVRDPSGPPLVQIVGTAPVRIEARLARALPEGAELTFVAIDGTRVPLRDEPDASIVDPADGTRRIWLSPRETTALPDGLRGTLEVRLSRPGVVEVPARAVGRDEHGAFVLRRVGAGSERVAVAVLTSGGGSAIVEGALAEGDSISSDAATVLAPPGGP